VLLGACYTCSKSANFFEFYSAFFADSYAQDVMKIVKNQVVPILQIPVRLILRFTLLASCLFCSSWALAQNDKQISYSVAVPVEQRTAAASSVSVPPVPTAPVPVIRPIDEASTTPSPVRTKKSKKKVIASEDETPTPSKKTASKKAQPNDESGNKKIATVKTVKTTTAKTPPTNKKTTVAKTTESKKIAPEKTVVQASASSPPGKIPTAPVPTKTIAVAATAAATATATALAAAHTNAEPNEETQLANSLNEEENSTPNTEPVNVASVDSAVSNVALPMSSEREGYVLNFKHFVETRIVPHVPGVGLAIIADGKVKVLQAYGVRRVGSNELVDTNTVFRLASISKSFSATAASMLVRDGLITWDTPVTTILPDVQFSNPHYGSELTVRNILSQSTGLPTHSGDNFIEDGMSYDETLSKLRAINFICPPGKCYNYQNVTYSLIGKIINKKTGRSYEQYLKERVLNPLGMRTASVGLAGLTATNNYASPHIPTRRGWVPTEVTEKYYRLNPAAGVNASITDMSHWILAQMGRNPTVLQPAMLNSIHAKITRNTPAQNYYSSREGVTDTHYGMGWRVFDYRGDKNFVHHGGGVLGYRTEMVFNSELQIGMVILTNTGKLASDTIFEFLDAYEDEKHGDKRQIPKPVATPVKKKK